MNRILAIETTTKVCSVAVFENGNCLHSEESNNLDYDAAENLNPFIVQVLAKAGWELSSLSAIAVSMGPGSYTGLRIGVASAKGLCYALNIPLIAVNPLAAMLLMLDKKRGGLDSAKTYMPMLDARRREVFAQSFNANHNAIDEVDARILEDNDPLLANDEIHFFGPGADKFEDELVGNNTLGIYPSAIFMGHIAQEKFQAKDFSDLAYFEPFYLKDFIAIKAKPKFNRRNT